MCCHSYAPHQARHAANLIALQNLNPLIYRQDRPGRTAGVDPLSL